MIDKKIDRKRMNCVIVRAQQPPIGNKFPEKNKIMVGGLVGWRDWEGGAGGAAPAWWTDAQLYFLFFIFFLTPTCGVLVKRAHNDTIALNLLAPNELNCVVDCARRPIVRAQCLIGTENTPKIDYQDYLIVCSRA
jgi:hypothetical protein